MDSVVRELFASIPEYLSVSESKYTDTFESILNLINVYQEAQSSADKFADANAAIGKSLETNAKAMELTRRDLKRDPHNKQ